MLGDPRKSIVSASSTLSISCRFTKTPGHSAAITEPLGRDQPSSGIRRSTGDVPCEHVLAILAGKREDVLRRQKDRVLLESDLDWVFDAAMSSQKKGEVQLPETTKPHWRALRTNYDQRGSLVGGQPRRQS